MCLRVCKKETATCLENCRLCVFCCCFSEMPSTLQNYQEYYYVVEILSTSLLKSHLTHESVSSVLEVNFVPNFKTSLLLFTETKT